jgi:hypothetical protein
MPNRIELWARAALLFLLLPSLPAVAVAGDQQFDTLVDRMSDYCQKRPMWGMGLIGFIANRFTPHGVGHLQVAVFDDIPSTRRESVEKLTSSLQNLVGPDYQSFVRDRNNRTREVSLIYVREAGKNSFEMLIVSIDPTDAVLMKMRLDPDAMRDWMDEPVSRGRYPNHLGR